MSTANTQFDSHLLREYVLLRPATAVLCPACKGGQSGEKTFRLSVMNGFMRGKCFRASCGFYHGDYVGGAAGDEVADGPRLNPYTGPLRGLDPAEKAWWLKRYGFPVKGVASTDDGRYALPIWDETSEERGIVLRVPHLGSPLRGERDYFATPKAVVHRAVGGPCMSWYHCTAPGVDRDRAVLVEDQISAMKLRYFGAVTATALLGTDLTHDKVAELQRSIKRIVIALDADATAKAFEMARRWGKAFESCKVMILARDIKDSEAGEFLPALGKML